MKIALFLLVAGFLTSCGSDSGRTLNATTSSLLSAYIGSPLCDEIASPGSKELFSYPIVDPNSISEVYVYGSTEPSDLQEVINFEMGFYIHNKPEFSNVPLNAPAKLYVKTIEFSKYDHNNDGIIDKTDYGMRYEVCSTSKNGKRESAVEGNFAHIKVLSPELLNYINVEKTKLENGSITPAMSPLKCDSNINAKGTCTLFISIIRESNPDFKIEINKGQIFGYTAFPGIDANLFDTRLNNGLGNFFIKRDRWGAESGHARGYRYGVCTFEYFTEPLRSQYLDRVGSNDFYINKEDNDHPCGLLEVDLYSGGNALGMWIKKDLEHLYMSNAVNVEQVNSILGGMLVLSDHYLKRNTHSTISTNISALSGLGNPSTSHLVEFEKQSGDLNLTNIPFAEVLPGFTYCYQGNGFLNFFTFNYLLKYESAPQEKITIERLGDNVFCDGLKQEERVFTNAKIEFVR